MEFKFTHHIRHKHLTSRPLYWVVLKPCIGWNLIWKMVAHCSPHENTLFSSDTGVLHRLRSQQSAAWFIVTVIFLDNESIFMADFWRAKKLMQYTLNVSIDRSIKRKTSWRKLKFFFYYKTLHRFTWLSEKDFRVLRNFKYILVVMIALFHKKCPLKITPLRSQTFACPKWKISAAVTWQKCKPLLRTRWYLGVVRWETFVRSNNALSREVS